MKIFSPLNHAIDRTENIGQLIHVINWFHGTLSILKGQKTSTSMRLRMPWYVR